MELETKVTPIRRVDNAAVKARYFRRGENNVLTDCTDDVNIPCGWLYSTLEIDLLESLETVEDCGVPVKSAVCRLWVNGEFIGAILDAKEEQSGDTSIFSCMILVD